MSAYRKQILFFCDTTILCIVLGFFYVFSNWFWQITVSNKSVIVNFLLLYGSVTVSQLLFKTYNSLWRYAESREYLQLLVATAFGFFLYLAITTILRVPRISLTMLACTASLWLLGMLFLRFAYRLYRNHKDTNNQYGKESVAIIGAGAAGVQLMEELSRNPNSQYHVCCFFDDSHSKIHKIIRGIEVVGYIEDAPHLLRDMNIHNAIIAIPSMSEHKRKEILNLFSRMQDIKLKILPGTLEMLRTPELSRQLREVEIEDLLGRESITLNNSDVEVNITGKRVLVTGGGGSIGSELCRQIARFKPTQLIIFDIYENNAYDIQQELLGIYGDKLDLKVEIGSIRDAHRVDILFDTYKPQLVYHAAAHKHVPLMEQNPQEAIRNNVFGTYNLVQAAEQHGVSKFVQISTDKAVNPTNVMGASKRLCEMVLQSMNGRCSTDFVAVRFGNVLGSNGSVVPLFKRQIANGGPITITDKRIIRYFMTIPEAAQLVLQAAAMKGKNEIYVLDMGEPVKIIDLAENLIRLSGLVPYTDIDIVETGLRPGEKLYEELLIQSRSIKKTDNKKIFIEQLPSLTHDEIQSKLHKLTCALETDDTAVLIDVLHQVVPTFRSPEEVNKWQGDIIEVQRQEAVLQGARV